MSIQPVVADDLHALYLPTTTVVDCFRARGYEAIERESLSAGIQETEEPVRFCPARATCMKKTVRPLDAPSI